MSKAWTASSTPSSRDSTWNGKPAPSTYLHKQLDVTQQVDPILMSRAGSVDYFGYASICHRARYSRRRVIKRSADPRGFVALAAKPQGHRAADSVAPQLRDRR